jgi:hypothetical protein
MDYRLLNDAEKSKVGGNLPALPRSRPFTFTIAGAVEDGEVKGFAVLAFSAHCEPVYIAPKSHVHFRRLERLVEQEAKKAGASALWVFVHNEHIERMAELCGGELVETKVMRKEL